MSFLDDLEISKEVINGPYFGILYGPAGVGKTFICKHAERPFYVALEKGVEKVDGVGKFVKNDEIILPETEDQFFQMLQYFVKKEHDYKTIVVDSGMFADKLIIERVINDATVEVEVNGSKKRAIMRKEGYKIIGSIADFDYGTGYSDVVRTWEKRFFTALKYLHKKGLNVILIAHSRAKNVTDSQGNDYKKFGIDMAEFGIYSVPNLLSAKADWVLFMRSEVETKKVKNQFNTVKSVADTDKVPEITVYTRGTSAFDAKVRTEKISNVQDQYVIDISNPETSQKLFRDLTL